MSRRPLYVDPPLIPYHCGALWPDEMRTTSPTYRKLRRFYDPTKLDLREAAELIAFARLLEKPKFLRLFFGWKGKRISALTRLANHPPVARAADVYENENFSHWDDETGAAILARLIASGWNHGMPPSICREYVRSRLKAGMSQQKLADELGVPRHRLRLWVEPPRKPGQNRRSKAIAALVIA